MYSQICGTNMIELAKILLNLHPIDLMSLTWTSKAFRSLLLNRKLEWLWRRLYELNTAVPSCPEDMSPPEWTSLIFGEPVCQVSREAFRRSKETDNIQECGVNFAVCSFFLRKRICDHCHVSWVPIRDVEFLSNQMCFQEVLFWSTDETRQYIASQMILPESDMDLFHYTEHICERPKISQSLVTL